MSKYSLLVVFLFSMLIGCAPDLVPYYIGLFNRDMITVLDNSAVNEIKCEKQTNTSSCNTSYIVDLQAYKGHSDWTSFGAGQIIYATRYKCLPSGLEIAGFDDIEKPGKLFDIFNLYQTVEIPAGCEKLVIEAWGPKTAVRKGQIGGKFVYGTSLAVQHVKRWSEFFCREVYQAFVFCLILLSLISIRLRDAISDIKKDEIDESISFWVICAISSVGLIQLIFPILSLPQISNRFGTVFILTAFFLPFAVRISEPKFNLKLKTLAMLVFACLMMHSKFQVLFLFCIVSISFFGLIVSYRKKSLILFVLAIVEVISALKIYGVRPLPNAMTAYFFVGLLAFYKLSLRLKVTSSFSKFVSFVSKLDGHPSLAAQNIDAVVAIAKSLIDVPVFTLLNIENGSKIKIKQYEVGGKEFYVDAVPPMFAHAMSLRKEIWHLKVGSVEFNRIKKTGSPDWSRGSFISLVPIYDEEKMYGALAISGYSATILETQEYDLEQKAIIRVVSETLRSLLKKEESYQKSFWNELFISSNSTIAELHSEHTESEYPLTKVAYEISRILDASVFIAELDQKTRKFSMKGIHGFDPFVQERFIKGTVYANLDNEQGPVALAVNKKQAIIVSDVRLLKDVLHENSVQFFAKNNTLSCAGIPIFHAGTGEVWGVLWLERRKNLLPFDLLSEAPLVSLAGSVSLFIDRMEKNESILAANTTLQEFIPADVLEDVINHGKVREEDYGYLLMLDLKGSTKVSLEKGSDFWLNEAAKIKRPLSELGSKFGFTLREYKWDAFVFSLSASEVSKVGIDSTVMFCTEASKIIEDWYQESFTSVSVANREFAQKARFCITHGDISRGLIEGTVKTWGMVGSEIAAVTKMEDCCKKIEGVIFFDESVLTNETKSLLVDCGTMVASTNRKVFRVSETWIEMIEGFTDAA